MAILRGIQIEGFGFDPLLTGGSLFTNSTLTPDAATIYDWLPTVDPRDNSATRTEVDPFRGRFLANGFTLRISRSDRIASKLLSTPDYTEEFLATGISATTTSIPKLGISPKYGTGDVIYIGNEAILLGTDIGAEWTGCTRGMYGTKGEIHDGSDEVFGSSPYWFRRVVRIIEHDTITGAEEEIWQGLIEDTSQTGANISISIISVQQANARIRLNRGARNHARYTSPDNRRVWRADAAYRVRRQPVIARGVYVEHYQVGDKTILAVDQLVSNFPNLIRPYVAVLGVNSDPAQLPDELFDGADIWPLFVVDRDLDTTLPDAISSTADLPSPYHPVAIALALLTSTGTGNNGAYDVLGETWGMGLDYVDVVAFTDAITARPDLAVDRLVLGLGGERVDALRVITDKLLRPYGYSLTVASNGALGLCLIRLPSLEDRDEAIANTLTVYPDQLPEQRMQLPSRARRLVATLGGAPYSEERTISVQLTNRSQRPGKLLDAPELEYDFSTLKPDRLVSGEVLTTFAATLIGGLALALDSAPMLRIRCPSWRFSGLSDFAVGKMATVDGLSSEQAWWVLPNGQLTKLSTQDVSGVGLVVGLLQPVWDAWMTVDLLMVGGRIPDYVRLRAPSGEVEGWVPNALTIAAAEYSSDDPGTFEVGDEVSLWSSAGVLKSTATPQIIGIAANVLTLSGGFGAGTPVSSDILRVARSTEFDNTAHITDIKRPWTYMGDGDTGEFEDVDGATVFDVYGTEFFGGFDAIDQTIPDFTGLDDACTDSLSATESWPMDAWLGQTWRDREAWLLTRDVSVSQMLDTVHGADLSSYLGLRPFSSEEEMTVAVLPILLTEGLVEFHMGTVARVIRQGGGVNDATDAAVFFRLSLYDQSGVLIKRGEATGVLGTELDTPQWQPAETTLTLDAPMATPQAAYLVLYLSSRAANLADEPVDETTTWTFGTDVPSTARQGGTSVMVPTSSSFLDDTGAARPNAFGFDTQAMTIYRWSGLGGQSPAGYWDMLWRREASGGETEVILGPGPAQGLAIRLARFALTYAQLRGLEWTFRSADIGRPPAQLLQSPSPILGEVVGTHLTRTERVYRTPRPVYVGPRGSAPGSPYPTDYTQRWPRVVHSNSSESVLDSALLVLNTLNPEVRLLATFLPSFCVENFNDPVPEDLREFVTTAQWIVRVRVYEITGTSWTNVQTVDRTVTLDHWYTHAKQQGALVTELAHYSGDFPLKEGSIFQKDLPLLQTITVDLGQVSWDPTTDDTSLAFDITIQPTGTPVYTEKTHLNYRVATRVQLALCGTTLYEVP